MKEIYMNWTEWWFDFWFDNPILFIAVILIAIALAILQAKRRRKW